MKAPGVVIYTDDDQMEAAERDYVQQQRPA